MGPRHLRLGAPVGLLLVMTAGLAGCGRADADADAAPLNKTEDAMATLDEGHIEFALTATSAELRAALGPYASPRLEVTLAVEPTAR